MAVTIKKLRGEKDERFTLRISAKNKFALELLASKEGMTLSALISQIIKKPLHEELTVKEGRGINSKETYIPDAAYDILLPDRTVKLAMIAPDLLSDHEKIIWKVIQENKKYWSKNSPNFKAIRGSWVSIQGAALTLISQHSK